MLDLIGCTRHLIRWAGGRFEKIVLLSDNLIRELLNVLMCAMLHCVKPEGEKGGNSYNNDDR